MSCYSDDKLFEEEREVCYRCGREGCECDPETCDCEPITSDQSSCIQDFEE